MKGTADFITTDTYSVEIPPLLEEKIKEDAYWHALRYKFDVEQNE